MRKNIDLSDEAVKALSIQAIENGTNFKNYVEAKLEELAKTKLPPKGKRGREKNKKGFRTVFQTVNPKTGRINAPKFSTYSDYLLMVQRENGHISYIGGSLNGAERINQGAEFFNKYFDLFTPEQITFFYGLIFNMLKVETIAICQYCGANIESVKPVLDQAVKTSVKGFKEGGNLFNEIIIDIEKLNACKVPDFNPFRVTEYKNIVQEGMINPVVTQISDHDKRNGETMETIQAEESTKALIHESGLKTV